MNLSLFITAIKMGRPKKTDGSDSLSATLMSDLSNDSNSSFAAQKSPFSNKRSHSPSDCDDLDDPALYRYVMNPKKIKLEQTTDQSCDIPRDTIESLKKRSTSDMSYTQLTPITDSTDSGNINMWNNRSTGTGCQNSSWHQPAQSLQAQQTVVNSCVGDATFTAQTNPLSFIEDDMDDFLDYLQTDQSTRQTIAPTKIVSDNNQTQESYDFSAVQFPQSLSIETNQINQPTKYLNSPVSSPNYPNSPAYSDASCHSPQYQSQGSPAVYQPHSPVSNYCNSPLPNNQYQSSPVHSTQFANSPANCQPQFPNSPDCMYPSSPAESHTSNYCGSPRSSCQFSPPPMGVVTAECQQLVMKHDYKPSISPLHNTTMYSSTESFTR